MFKKIMWFVLFFVFLAGSILGIIFGIKYYNQKELNKSLYTQEEVEEKYQKYVNDIKIKDLKIDELNGQVSILTAENVEHENTISNLNLSINEKDEGISSLTSQVSSLTSNVSSLNLEIETLNSQIELLSEDKEQNLAEIETLINEKTQLENEKQTLQSSLIEKEQKLQTLSNEKTALLEEVDSLNTQITNNETTISELNSQVLSLQAEIERLNSLLEAYNDYVNQSIVLTYYVDNTLFDTQVITRGETTSQSLTPEDTLKYSFVKWQINGEDFDFSTKEFTLNTRIDAVLNYNIYSVSYVYNENTLKTEEVYGGDKLNCPEVQYDVDSEDFGGWSLSLENVEIIDCDTYVVTNNVTLYAIVNSKFVSIQNYNSSNVLEAYSVSSVSDFEKLATLTNAGTTFEGVTIYQTADVNFSSVSNWTPIGTQAKKFMGNFNGLNHYIDGFNYKGQLINGGNTVYFGLFGYISSTFKNLKFKNVDIEVLEDRYNDISRYCGVLAGYVSGVTLLENIVFESGSLTGFRNSSRKLYLGCIGNGSNNHVTNCVNYLNISNSYYCYLLGYSVYISNCINYGNITNVQVVQCLSIPYTTSSGEVCAENNQNFGVFENISSLRAESLPSYTES